MVLGMPRAAAAGMMGAPAGQPAGSEPPKEATMSDLAKTVGRITAVGAVALLLVGTADPAAARPRSEARAMARGMVAGCFEMGGDPDVEEWDEAFGHFIVSCDLPDGGEVGCIIPIGDDDAAVECEYS
jgi:hypothetical protein